MIGSTGPVGPKLFPYARYNADLSAEGLAAMSLPEIQPADVQRLDSVEHIPELRRVGQAAARKVRCEHFDGFLL